MAMADIDAASTAPARAATTISATMSTPALAPPSSNGRPDKAALREIYALPAPIRTFPLPSFYPNNPISLAHLLYKWLSQTILPPPQEPSIIHRGVWSASTRSVHITDPTSIRALWEQGFYGKGSLSRSEPNWLKRQQTRLGLVEAHVSEEFTVDRRNERIAAKWERARVAHETIEQLKLAEAQAAVAQLAPPVGPLELLSLPNSTTHGAQPGLNGTAKKRVDGAHGLATNGKAVPSNGTEPTTNNLEGLRMVNGITGVSHAGPESDPISPKDSGPAQKPAGNADENDPVPLKRRKSVRFSAEVQSTIFLNSDPPNPNHGAQASPKIIETSEINGVLTHTTQLALPLKPENRTVLATEDKEHLQLSLEEAFFLVFALGALQVIDPATELEIPTSDLLALFRLYSYFPPRTRYADLQPDDPFLTHYAVYHHFRSLGWVPRHGIKFGVDWLLYLRGPVFDHAEFGVIVLPSYTDRWWKDHGRKAPRRSWPWLHGTVRVLSHVLKSLILVYVDVPSPVALAEAMEDEPQPGGFAAALKLYTVREVPIRRWSSNRNRA